MPLCREALASLPLLSLPGDPGHSHSKEFFLADYLYRNALLNIFLGLAGTFPLFFSLGEPPPTMRRSVFFVTLSAFLPPQSAMRCMASRSLSFSSSARQHAGLVEQRMRRIEQIGRRDDVLCRLGATENAQDCDASNARDAAQTEPFCAGAAAVPIELPQDNPQQALRTRGMSFRSRRAHGALCSALRRAPTPGQASSL